MSEWILSSSILILLIVFIRSLFRNKIALRIRYALWLVVAVRLLFPLSFWESSFSVLNFLEWRDSSAQEGGYGSISPVPAATDVHEAVFREGEKAEYDRKVISEGESADRITPEVSDFEGEPAERISPFVPDMKGAEALNPNGNRREAGRGSGKQIDWKTLILGIWMAGSVFAAGTVLIVNGNYRRRLLRSRIRYETDAGSVLKVYLSSAVATPCMFGLLHPAVYLTPEVEGNEKKLKYVLCHENTHYRHFDHLWAAVRAVCVCIHWYNPLVWLAAGLSRQDCELACDEKALKLLDQEEWIDYGRTLLDFSIQRDWLPGGLQLSTAVSGGKRQLKERLLMIVGHPRRPVSAVILAAIMVLLVSAFTFTGRIQAKESAESEAGDRNGAQDGDYRDGAEGFDVLQEKDSADYSVQNTSIVTVDLNDGEDCILKIGGQIEGEDGIYRIESMELKRIYGRSEETLQTIRLEDVKVLYTRSLDEIRADGGDMWAFCAAAEALYAKALCTVEDLPAYAAEKFPTKESGKSVAELLTGGILVADLNFDGYQDFGLQGRSETENVPFYCFLWDPEKGKFEPASMIPNLQVDEQAGMLVSKTSDGDGVQSVKYYSFDENRTLHMVRYVETNPSLDAVFPVLDLTYCEVPYGLPAVDEWDYGTRYGGALTQRFVYWAKQALTELYEWSGTKLDQVCFTITEFGDLYFGNSPEDVRASRTFYNRCYGEQAGFEFCIPSMTLATERVVWYSPVIQWRVPENLAQMTDEEVALWYFDRSGLAEGEKAETIELSDEGSYIIKTRAGNYYTISLQGSTREVHDIYGPYEGYPYH